MVTAILVIVSLILALVILSLWMSVANTDLLFNKFTSIKEHNEYTHSQFTSSMTRLGTLARNVGDHQNHIDNQLEKFDDVMNQYIGDVNEQIKNLINLAKFDIKAARLNELIQAKAAKSALERAISATTLSRQAPSANDAIALEIVTNRINELTKILDQRGSE